MSSTISRRKLLQQAAITMGMATASSQWVSVALAYTPQPELADRQGKILSQRQMADLRAICAQVIPATDTPGAAEVDVHGFIDNQLKYCHDEDDQQQAVRILDRLHDASMSGSSTAFHQLEGPGQLKLLQDLEATRSGFSADDRGDFKFVKGMILMGYFTSEVGMTQELAYLPVPGGFTGSIPYDSVGSAWALP